jgi:sugar phosphate isomerase/epimerase
MFKKIILTVVIFVLLIVLLAFVYTCSPSKKPITQINAKEVGWEFGVQMYAFKKYPFATSLDLTKLAGISIIEEFNEHKMGKNFGGNYFGKMDDANVIKLQKLLKDKNVTMSSVYANSPKDIKEWNNYFKNGKKLGIKFIVCEPKKNEINLLDSLSEVTGIKIALHDHPKGESDYWHPDSVLAVIKDRKNFGACADLGHWARSGLDPVTCLKKLEGHILGIHAKDINEFGNIYAEDVEPGKGVIDFNGVFKELQRQNFKGIMYFECEYNFFYNILDIIKAKKYLLAEGK